MISAGIRTAARTAQTGTLFTDAGSVKGPISTELSNGMPDGVAFIGSHPLAGSERGGFEHARADLFDGRVVVITPEPETPAADIARLRAFWEFLGADVVELTADQHDEFLAHTSHLPHVVAAALAAALPEAARPFAATGFRDTTRIAAGDPDLWTGIVLQNADNLLAALDAHTAALAEFRAALAAHDAARLKSLLQQAKTNRDALPSSWDKLRESNVRRDRIRNKKSKTGLPPSRE
jgi:prephenate dehydrogenase